MADASPFDTSAESAARLRRDPDTTLADVGNAAPGAEPPPGYELIRELGRGGMGVVYLARQTAADRLVALKMVLAGSYAGDVERQRFRTEAQAIAGLSHPHIVHVYEVGEHRGVPFFSLEYCPEGSLDSRLEGTPLRPTDAARLVAQLARAAHAAHLQGVVHRDLKPGNVLIAADGSPKLTDFGLAKRIDAVPDGNSPSPATQTGNVVGTPSYMAPEQASGATKDITAAADVYALGAVLYECLTGRPPFRAASAFDTIRQVIDTEPVAPSQLNARTPADLEVIALKCLQKDPRKRYESAAALADDLERYLDGRAIVARPVGKLERGWRWCRRNPAVALLLAALMLVMAIGAGTATLFALRADLERDQAIIARAAEADRARELRIANDEQFRRRAEAEAYLERAERLLYANELSAALREWDAGNASAAWRHLEACRWDRRGWEFDYAYTRFTAGHVALAFPGKVSTVAVSPDGKLIAAGGLDLVRVWDAATGEVLRDLAGDGVIFTSVAFGAGGKTIAAGTHLGGFRFWNLPDGGLVVSDDAGLVGRSVVFSPDGARIAVAGGAEIHVVDARTGKALRVITGFQVAQNVGRGAKLAFNPDGTQLVGVYRNEARVWDAASGRLLKRLRGHTEEPHAVAFGAGGRVAAAANGNPLRIWDASTGRPAIEIAVGDGEVSDTAFAPDGRLVATANRGGLIRIFDATTGTETRSLVGHRGDVNAIAFAPSGRWLVSGGDDGTVRVWDARPPSTPMGPASRMSVGIAQFSPDGRQVALLDYARRVTGFHVWELRERRELFADLTPPITGIAFAPGSRVVRVDPFGVILSDPSTRRSERLPGAVSDPTAARFTADGRRLVVLTEANDLRFWEPADFDRKPSPGPRLKASAEVKRALFSSDLTRVAGLDQHQLAVWDTSTGEKLRTLAGGFTTPLAFSPDGRWLVATTNTGGVTAWDLAGEAFRSFRGHGGDVASAAFLADGTRLATASMDGTVKVWEFATSQELLTFRQPVHPAALAFHDNMLASIDTGASVREWESSTKSASRSVESPVIEPLALSFSADGTQILARRENRAVLAWGVRSGREEPPTSEFPAEPLTRSPDGRLSLDSAGGHIVVTDLSLSAKEADRRRAFLARLVGD